MKHIYILVFLTLYGSLNASVAGKRTQIADSVSNVIRNIQLSDSGKAIYLSELALMDYFLDLNNESSTGYMNTAMSHARKWHNTDPLIFTYGNQMQMGASATDIDRYADSCIYYIQASADPLARSVGWQQMAKIKVHTPEALDYLLLALDEIKGKGYWMQEQAVYFDLTHYFHTSVNDYPQLITYAELALGAALKTNNPYVIAKSRHDVGVAYYMNFTTDPENTGLIENSFDAFRQTYAMYHDKIVDHNNRAYQLLFVTTLINLSNIAYIYEDFKAAENYLKEALEISLAYNMSNEIDYSMKPYIYHSATMYILQSYTTLSKIARESGNNHQAENYLLKALDFLPANLVDDVRNGRYPTYRLNLELADLYTAMGRYKDAVTYYSAGFAEYQANYEFQLHSMTEHLAGAYEKERKEKQLELLDKSLFLKTKQRYLIATLIVFLMIGLIILFFFLKYRLLSLKKQNQVKNNGTKRLKLSKEQEELEGQLNILKTEKYHKELLAGSLLVDHKTNVLEELRSLFRNNKALNKYKEELEEIFEDDHKDKEGTDFFKTDLQDVHPVFYARLQKQADNKLTALDLKYCHMIFMRMSSKEIAEILSVDPKTVRVTKYRLKQKLNLDKSEDLNSFIEQVGELISRENT